MKTKTKDPDNLLRDINQSIMIKGLLIATAIHAVLILGTSFGLYRDWATYGFLKTPSSINQEKQKVQREKEEAERQAVAAQRAAEREAAAQAAAASKAPAPTRGGAPSAGADADSQTPTTSPLEGETLPPATGFSLDGFGL